MRIDYDHLRRHFGDVWPTHVEEFTKLLIDLRREFGGDLDLMLVLAVIGTRSLPRQVMAGLSYDAFASPDRGGAPAPINTQSIALCTGIPRETVRRKVARLEAVGWIERSEEGYLVASKGSIQELAPLTQATLHYLAAVTSACLATLEPAGRDASHLN